MTAHMDLVRDHCAAHSVALPAYALDVHSVIMFPSGTAFMHFEQHIVRSLSNETVIDCILA
jgi:hypothetical protein